MISSCVRSARRSYEKHKQEPCTISRVVEVCVNHSSQVRSGQFGSVRFSSVPFRSVQCIAVRCVDCVRTYHAIGVHCLTLYSHSTGSSSHVHRLALCV